MLAWVLHTSLPGQAGQTKEGSVGRAGHLVLLGFAASKHFPSPGDFPNQGIELRSSALQMDSLPTELSGKPSKSVDIHIFDVCYDRYFLSKERDKLIIEWC